MTNGIFFINQVRTALHEHFQKKNILLFASSSLVQSGAMEPYLDAFYVQSQSSQHKNYFLPTSPEFALKKALAFYPPHIKGVYDIAHAFRDEKISVWHRHEFTMVEWYCKECDYLTIPKQIISLLQAIAQTAESLHLKTDILLTHQNQKIYDVAELFQKFTNFVLTPQTTFEELLQLAKKHNIYFHAAEKKLNADWLEIYSVLFAQLIEPQIKNLGHVVFIKNFPPLTSAMSKLNKEGWASRIECYLSGIEIANGYQELDDSITLQSIWKENNNMRLSMNKKIHPLDETLIALTPNMKNVCGTALGLERTLMALYPEYTIEDFYIT